MDSCALSVTHFGQTSCVLYTSATAFNVQINKLLAVIPRERNTYLFSATMTSKVAKLQRASLRDPVKVEVAHKFTTPKTLVQQYLFIPAKYKVHVYAANTLPFSIAFQRFSYEQYVHALSSDTVSFLQRVLCVCANSTTRSSGLLAMKGCMCSIHDVIK